MKHGLSKKDSPAGEEDTIVLFVAAKFDHQSQCQENRQSDQCKHEWKSEAHYGIYLLPCLFDSNIAWLCKALIKLGIRFIEEPHVYVLKGTC